ncbi:MAG: small multi-drug export protein [Clostridiales bacterium]|jgi:uncharacterized membrane protein|nr:small multi-drug export protein [Clostridiales bacterium]
MSEAIISFLQSHGIPREIIIAVISMLPVMELRLGLIAASVLGVPLARAFAVCFLANILPIPLILLFVKQIFTLMKKHAVFPGLVTRLEKSALRKSGAIKEKLFVGLFLFVAVPLPGTGAWTGALIAALIGLPVRRSFFTIAAGVLGAGLIMIILTYFIPGLFGFK